MNKKLLAICVLSAMTTSAFAKNRLTIEETFTVEENSAIHFEIPVGSIELETHSGDEVEIEVLVKENDNDWFSSVDLDDVELESKISGRKVHFEIDVDETIQEWVVRVPKSAHLNIQMGVGEVELEDVGKDVFVEVGVGEVDVRLADNDYRKVELESGVGGTDLNGFKGVSQDRNIVSENTSWRGDGEYVISVEVGVGDVDVDY